MTHHDGVAEVPRCPHTPWWLLLGMLGAVMLMLAGCGHTAQTRAKIDEVSEPETYDVQTIGDKTTVGNAQPLSVGGVGLVIGLEGTGGPAPADGYRSMLEDNLRKEGIKNVKEILNSTDCALVIVEAILPPGGRKGDAMDVEVKLPPGSKATSLRGGTLRKCQLFNYDFARNLRPDYNGPRNMLMGHPVASAQGPVLVGVGDGDEAARVKQGRIWAGGRCNIDNPFALIMNPSNQFASLTSLIMDRVNSTFQGGTTAPVNNRLAHTKDNIAVTIKVPSPYRLNQERYLRVVRLIPLRDVADVIPQTEKNKKSYRQRLGEDLLDPNRTVTAALRLEALGEKSIPTLKEGLKSSHPLVRFCSAEALAYLGSPSCGEELGRCVVDQPLFRSLALMALASLDEAVSHVKLKEILFSSTDDEVRTGTFRALRLLNESDPVVKGDLLNDAFWLHRVGTSGPALIHLATTKRAEVLLMGETPSFKGAFSFLAGEFTLTAGEGDAHCTVTRVTRTGERGSKTCSLAVEDVLRTVAELGGGYSEVLALLQQGHECHCLSCRVRVDALPQATSVYDLIKGGKEMALSW